MKASIKIILNTIHPIKCNTNIILAHGEFPQDKYLQGLLLNQININAGIHKNNIDNASRVLICCDGAIENLIKYPNYYEPNYIIGDCDSIDSATRHKYKDKIITITNQDINDLTKAIELAYTLGLEDIIILGATGLREDHSLANIALLTTYVSKFT